MSTNRNIVEMVEAIRKGTGGSNSADGVDGTYMADGKVSKSGEEGLWGRIKSEQPYNGKYVPVWICLSYTEKV